VDLNTKLAFNHSTYDWIKSFLKITIKGRAIYGNLENTVVYMYDIKHG
jgi:hypothetical protein